MKTTTLLASLAFVLASCTKQETADTATSAATAAKPYPLDVCLVSGEKLGEMGDPVVTVYQGQEIKFCCDKCIPKFQRDPVKYLAKLKDKEATSE